MDEWFRGCTIDSIHSSANCIIGISKDMTDSDSGSCIRQLASILANGAPWRIGEDLEMTWFDAETAKESCTIHDYIPSMFVKTYHGIVSIYMHDMELDLMDPGTSLWGERFVFIAIVTGSNPLVKFLADLTRRLRRRGSTACEMTFLEPLLILVYMRY